MTLTGDFFAPPVQVLPQAPPEEARVGSETGLPQGLALGVAGLALLLSLGLQQLSHHLADPARQYDRQLRQSLVLTLAFYLLLGVVLAAFCVRRQVGLTWLRGQAVDALVLGLPLGALGGGLAVALNSAVSGHLASDPNAELLVGGGGALRIGLTLAVTAVLAPLVEETLFRGVLAGTLLARGPAPAVWVSAIAFAVWHMNPTSLRYYVFMGLLLATLWRKRGLVASMSAHAAFNGVLTLAAVAATTGGGQLTQVGTITFSLPGGWHPVTQALPAGGRAFQGPAGAGLVVLTHVGPNPTREQVHQSLLRAEQGSALRAVVAGSERDLSLPAGQAVTADLEVAGQPGHLLDLITADAAYELVVVTGGSPAAERDWQHVLASLSSGGR